MALPQKVIKNNVRHVPKKNYVSMEIITSSITYLAEKIANESSCPAEKIANGSPIFANKWNINYHRPVGIFP